MGNVVLKSARICNGRDQIFSRDNQSTMKLEKNGKRSSGLKTRHIDIRYFVIKDSIITEGIHIIYGPTEKMLADFLQNHYCTRVLVEEVQGNNHGKEAC